MLMVGALPCDCREELGGTRFDKGVITIGLVKTLQYCSGLHFQYVLLLPAKGMSQCEAQCRSVESLSSQQWCRLVIFL